MEILILNNMKRFFQRPYIFWVIGIFILYLLFDVFISGFNKTIPLLLRYTNTVNWWELSFSLFFTLLIGFLIALNAVSLFTHYRERQNCKKQTLLSSVGGVGGLAVGVCPVCVTGIFPLLLGVFGVSFSFATLPFQGLEVQALIVVILGASIYMLKKN